MQTFEPFIDYYEILQVSPKAESEIIEAAYKKLAHKYHPDINKSQNAHEQMKLINIAHDTLCNVEKRKTYHNTWLQKQKVNINSPNKFLITDHRWHDIDYKNLKQWVKKRKAKIDTGEVLKGRYFRYRLNNISGKYQFRLRYRYKTAFYILE